MGCIVLPTLNGWKAELAWTVECRQLQCFRRWYCRNVADKQKGVAGMMAAFSLILGIFCGIIFSFPMIAVVENFGSSRYEPLVCDLPGATDISPVNASSMNGLDMVSASLLSP